MIDSEIISRIMISGLEKLSNYVRWTVRTSVQLKRNPAGEGP